MIEIAVRNTGTRAGSTVVQLYSVGDAGPRRPHRQLVAFTRATLEPDDAATLRVTLDLRPLARRVPASHEWTIVPADYRLEASRFAGDPGAATAPLDVW